MCVTNDEKSPNVPLHTDSNQLLESRLSRQRYSVLSPVVRLRERRLGVSEQPPVSVGGMEDVDVSPLERTGGRSDSEIRNARPLLVRMVVRAGVCTSVRRGGEIAEEREREGEPGHG